MSKIQLPRNYNDNIEIDASGFNPDKYAVKLSRTQTLKQKEELKKLWVSEAIKGSILVSPFISKEEKEIRDLVESCNGKTILIQHQAFGSRYKPPGHLFELCETGRLLIISLGLPPKTTLSREICTSMNSLAEKICSDSSRF